MLLIYVSTRMSFFNDNIVLCKHVFIIMSSIMVVTLFITCHYFVGDQADYCQGEVFTANCDHGRVVVMTTAMYGRMQRGRCVTTIYGSVGCGSDVLRIVDQYCSGRKSCEMPIPNKMLDARSCWQDSDEYLSASYDCIDSE